MDNSTCIIKSYCIIYKKLTKKLYTNNEFLYRMLLLLNIINEFKNGMYLIKANKPLTNGTKVYFKKITEVDEITDMIKNIKNLMKEIDEII